MLERNIFIEEYVKFDFANGTEVITFSNREVRGDISISFNKELGKLDTAKGYASQTVTSVPESWAFNITLDQGETLNKLRRIYELLADYNQVEARIVSSYLYNPLSGEIESVQEIFENAVIELDRDFRRIGRGIGITSDLEIGITVYESKILTVPNSGDITPIDDIIIIS